MRTERLSIQTPWNTKLDLKMRKPSILFALGLFLLANLFASGLIAQEKEILERGMPSRYFIGKEETMLLPVNILGLVKKPGQYMVPFGTNLIALVAYAGGFQEDAKINDIKIIRYEHLNGKTDSTAIVLHVDLKRYFEAGDLRQIPKLMPDDTIVVSGTRTRTINKIFAFVAKLVPFAQLYFLIKVASER